MSVNINKFKVFCDFVSNKVQEGNAYALSDFGDICNRAQMQLFERDYQTFIKTEEISEFLKVFLKNTVFGVPLTGLAPYPSDYQHLISLRKYLNGKMTEIKEVKNVDWAEYQVSQLMQPTLQFPKYNEFSNVIRFLPKNIGIIEIDYLKTPVVPVWNFTVTNGAPLYNPTGSVNFEWSEYNFNEVSALFLAMIGCNIKDNDLLGFSQLFAQQNNSNL